VETVFKQLQQYITTVKLPRPASPPVFPGGSAAASDAIHREVVLLRKAGKPVVVSMGNAAASGEEGWHVMAQLLRCQCGSRGKIGRKVPYHADVIN